ncbi:hypothetical protein L1887_13806 [Cichorium endivia]|nr:hypothetical protein L1887_13806 [Cichorium endivia]
MAMNPVWGLLMVMVVVSGCFIKEQRQSFAQALISASTKVRDASLSSRPETVKIGSVLAFGSNLGKVAKIALEIAVEDVNSDPTVLNGTRMKLTIHNSNSSGFLSIMEV